MMNRRDWLRRTSAAAAVPLVGRWLPAELIDWGHEVHAAAQSATTSSLGSELMSRLLLVCERIIPTDETPGAVTAGVPPFIDHMLTAWYDPPDRQRVVEGLQSLDQQTRARFGRAFVEASADQQDTLLLELDAQGVKSWFNTVKYLTIWGYYTSQVGITQELQQRPSPGRYDGCVPYAPRTRADSQAHATNPEVWSRHEAE
jgi:gluconate 2-dehydrogenase gamma chain